MRTKNFFEIATGEGHRFHTIVHEIDRVLFLRHLLGLLFLIELEKLLRRQH